MRISDNYDLGQMCHGGSCKKGERGQSKCGNQMLKYPTLESGIARKPSSLAKHYIHVCPPSHLLCRPTRSLYVWGVQAWICRSLRQNQALFSSSSPGACRYKPYLDQTEINILQAIFSSTDVVQVNISAASGDMGILANHVPSIEPLRPGVVEVIESGNASKKWFSECAGFGFYTFTHFHCFIQSLVDLLQSIRTISLPSTSSRLHLWKISQTKWAPDPFNCFLLF